MELQKTKHESLMVGTRSNGFKYSVRLNRHRIFTPDEWNKFYNSLHIKNRMFFQTLIQTGARINEAAHIKKEDIDFCNKVIILKVVKRRNRYADGKVRKIRISTQYNAELELFCKNLKEEDFIFTNNFHAIKTSSNNLLKRHLKKIGIDDWYMFSIHNIRKTTECWLNFLGINHLILLLHFGHNSSTAINHYLTTDIYNGVYKFKARQVLGDLYM